MIRLACVLTSLLAFMLQGSGGGHMLLVEHTRCAVHGELIHGDAHRRHAGADRQTESAVLQGSPDTGSEEAHDHCPVFTERRDARVSIADAGANFQASVTHRDFRILSAVIAASTPRLRIAPKTSPPA